MRYTKHDGNPDYLTILAEEIPRDDAQLRLNFQWLHEHIKKKDGC